jgi:hypothetical protein
MSGRSFSPIQGKPLFYRGDGSGRDTYVLTDSGGNMKGGRMALTGSKFRPSSVSRSRGDPVRLDGRPIHYRPDGSGRDNYISVNSGGICRDSHEGSFMSNLRTYERARTPLHGTKDYFTWAQIVTQPNELPKEKEKKIIINGLVRRLSPPKKRPQFPSGYDFSSYLKSTKTPLGLSPKTYVGLSPKTYVGLSPKTFVGLSPKTLVGLTPKKKIE